ncbi:MAG: hypothetical protein M1830_002804, partial [Pleopsidium flavum]
WRDTETDKLMMALESLEPVISASNTRSHYDSQRPRTLHVSKSFSRLEPSTSSPLRHSQADVLHSADISEILTPENITFSPKSERAAVGGDIFEKPDSDDEAKHGKGRAVISGSTTSLSEGFDNLPIELISLTDRLENIEGSKGQGSLTSLHRFIESLTAKVYSTPPSIDKLADLFQDFYIRTAAHISTHISMLSFRQYREKSPIPSISSRSSSVANSGNRVVTRSSKESLDYAEKPGPEQQMLTTAEIADKRRARRVLEQKRLALEEAVERRACEGVYDRIWRHRSTLDEVRDEKLRSRTAALSLVGIGLKELGVDINPAQARTSDRESQIREWLSGAREGLIKMNDERYPLGKLQHLAAAHKSIVDVLSKIQTSSSSADEILPTMIYSLLTTPREGINVISNLHFIQRFRAVSKVDGEAAYCLTNLEAAISFLETVDLASLRADEALEGPTKSNSRPSTPLTEQTTPWGALRPSSPSLSSPVITPAVGTSSTATSATSHKPLSCPASSRPSPPTSPLHQRRLSHLLQPSTNAIGVASDAVRTTADQGFKNISNTLDNSFKFLFGRLKEREISGDGCGAVLIPKTLDDARRLVNPSQRVEDNGNVSGASSIVEQPEGYNHAVNVRNGDKMLDLIGGHKQTRERSVDSTQSNGSGKRVSFATDTEQGNMPVALSVSAPSAPGNAAMESMRNLGNTLNPLNRLAGMNVMRGFGRTASNTPPAIPASAERSKELGLGDSKSPAEPRHDTTREIRMPPPIQRFLEIDGAGDLKMNEITELLDDYRRLARALQDMRAF